MKRFFLVLVLFLTLKSFAQHYPKYTTPLKYSPILVSTFGELRPDHFHSGLDFSTHATAGIPVYALDNGYVSRIKVSANGYGNALYITYDNGYKSVYGHLLRYASFIDTFVRSQQYLLETFEITLYPLPGQIRVKKGQIVGYVGNTGRSAAPHLHFEMRSTYRDRPLNPLFFGLGVRDHTPPRIYRIGIYPASDSSLVRGKHKKLILPLSSVSKPVKVAGPVYFAIESYDYTDKHRSRKGLYSVKLFVDDSLVFAYRFDSISFLNTRYVNTLLDYAEYKKRKIKLQRSYISPNNRLCIYTTEGNGAVLLDDGIHEIKYVVSDFFGNKAVAKFTVNSSVNSAYRFVPPANTVLLYPKEDNTIDKGNVKIFIPAYALYDTVYFRVDSAGVKGYSKVYKVHNRFLPLQSPAVLKIKPSAFPADKKNKFVLVRMESNKVEDYYPALYRDGFVTAAVDRLGQFYVDLDTVAPRIELISKMPVRKGRMLYFGIKDDKSGVADYDCYLNGKWFLLSYDGKSNRLYARVDSSFVRGENKIYIEVKDQKNNKARYDFTITVE